MGPSVAERTSVHSSGRLSPPPLFPLSEEPRLPWNWCKAPIPKAYLGRYSALSPNLRNGNCLSEERARENMQALVFAATELQHRTTASSSALAVHSSGEVANMLHRHKRAFHYDLAGGCFSLASTLKLATLQSRRVRGFSIGCSSSKKWKPEINHVAERRVKKYKYVIFSFLESIFPFSMITHSVCPSA